VENSRNTIKVNTLYNILYTHVVTVSRARGYCIAFSGLLHPPLPQHRRPVCAIDADGCLPTGGGDFSETHFGQKLARRCTLYFNAIIILYEHNITYNTYTALRGVCDYDNKNDIIWAGTRPIYTHHRCSKLVSPPPLRYLYTVRGGIWLLL